MGDRTTNTVEEGVKTRLLKFLTRDKIGIRKCLLGLFLHARNCTTYQLHEQLTMQGFDINYRAVSSMVGQMHTRLGILQIYLKREHRIYSLKEDHRDLVEMVLGNSSFLAQNSKPVHL